MRVFVTGVAGQLGHDVVNELISRGFEAVGTDLAPAYAGGRYRSIPEKYLIHHRGTELHIESPESLSVNIDGELAVSHSVDFRVIPGGVNFIFPREMEFFKSSPSEYQDILSKSKISL